MVDETQIIESKDQLVAHIAGGSSPKDDWRIGTEHEKFVFHRSDNSPLAYEGEVGIKSLLEAISKRGWDPVYEGGNLIALLKDGASVTLEPGGQLELSGAPLKSIHETCTEVNSHLRMVKDIGEEMDVGFLGLGFHPTEKRDDIPHMPKGRYGIMRSYMPKKGNLGLDMMHRTSTVQVNLDYSSEADMVKKMRVGLALQPVATALFANSPFTEGKPNGFKSFRSNIWTDTDPDRTGMLPFVFEDGFSFERWVDYVLDVPMYFVYRDGYIDAQGQSFKDFMAGKLPAYMGHLPTMTDWLDQLTMPFPEVRLKTYIEMRGADGGPWSRLCALPAFWTGLLYDQDVLDAAWDEVKDWSMEEMEQLRHDVARQALDATIRGEKLQHVAKRIVDLADKGLGRRALLNGVGDSEQVHLQVLKESVASGHVPADELLEAYEGRWQGDVSHVFKEYSY